MITDTATTEQEQGQWVLVHDDCVSMYSPTVDAKLVYLRKGEGFHQAMLLGPANVYNVDAYPAVVEAAKEYQREQESPVKDLMLVRQRREELFAALALVHPAPAEDKT